MLAGGLLFASFDTLPKQRGQVLLCFFEFLPDLGLCGPTVKHCFGGLEVFDLLPKCLNCF